MSYCDEQKMDFVQCRAMDTTGHCSKCDSINFETIGDTFTKNLRGQFMGALAFASPSEPDFCSAVKGNVCADYRHNACCCEPEVAAWQACLIEKDFATAIGQKAPCKVPCAIDESNAKKDESNTQKGKVKKPKITGCTNELQAANDCVARTEQCESCFDPPSFLSDFPLQAENYFRGALARASPIDPEFCVEANWIICKKFYPMESGPSSCCCLPETKKYFQCMFRERAWFDKYQIADQTCEYDGCEMFDLEGTMYESEQRENTHKSKVEKPNCSIELQVANDCVTRTKHCSICFDQHLFLKDFPTLTEQYFRATFAFTSPSDPNFCSDANWRMCMKFYPLENGPSSCCCLLETKKYIQCKFNEGSWFEKYGVYNLAHQTCEYDGCEMFDLEGTMNDVEKLETADPFKTGFTIGVSVGCFAIGPIVGLLGFLMYHRKTKSTGTEVTEASESGISVQIGGHDMTSESKA